MGIKLGSERVVSVVWAMRGQSAAANTTLEVRASHKYVYNRVSGEAVGRANGEMALDQILSFRIISGN